MSSYRDAHVTSAMALVREIDESLAFCEGLMNCNPPCRALTAWRERLLRSRAVAIRSLALTVTT